MDSVYICPECGQEYDEPGICDSCQVELIEEGGDEELGEEGLSLDDESGGGNTSSYGMGSGGFDDEEDTI
ncbi:hypothetical protein HY621_00415 [Candidatus Uhrbacteria bacterium]|nr:hypothetical protein [Candidatus Uhrbacteria bacterium]